MTRRSRKKKFKFDYKVGFIIVLVLLVLSLTILLFQTSDSINLPFSKKAYCYEKCNAIVWEGVNLTSFDNTQTRCECEFSDKSHVIFGIDRLKGEKWD